MSVTDTPYQNLTIKCKPVHYLQFCYHVISKSADDRTRKVPFAIVNSGMK